MEQFTHNNPLFEHAQMIVKYVLPEMLDYTTQVRFAQCCKFTFNAFKDYQAVWDQRLKVIANKYQIELEQREGDEIKFSQIDLTERDAIINQRIYRVKGTDHTFRMFTKDGIATCAELRGSWAWTNDERNYELVE
jgi:hypothetical protein